jgi:predicted DCC family thiol-disulfide oxidoreductase YuxK
LPDGEETTRIFYDGHCGLCHGFVRFVIRFDRSEGAFRFAPLDSAAFRGEVPEVQREGLPDSVVVLTPDRRLLSRSDGVLFVLDRLGGPFRWLGRLARLVPRAVRDAAYDGIARVRHRLFRRPAEACPVVPPHLRGRFDV